MPLRASAKNERRMDMYSGISDASGNYSVVYSIPFIDVPMVTPMLLGADVMTSVRLVSSSTTGFTVKVEQRTGVNILGLIVVLAAVINFVGASVNVLAVDV